MIQKTTLYIDFFFTTVNKFGIIGKQVSLTVAGINRKVVSEESPGSVGQGCRVTPGGGNSKESATENYRRFCR